MQSTLKVPIERYRVGTSSVRSDRLEKSLTRARLAAFWSAVQRHRYAYLLAAPGMLYLLLFRIGPMWGLLLAFQRYNPIKGIWHSEWVGLKNFADLFLSRSFPLLLRNTLAINVLSLAFFFPAPIVLAIMLSEIRIDWLKRLNQSIVYMPHFLSWVVISSLTFFLLSTDIGLLNKIVRGMGHESVSILTEPKYFWGLIVGQTMWRNTGWGTILFLAAISGIDPQQYEAALIDGCGRWRQIVHVTLPGIRPTVVVLLILRLGQIINTSFEQMLLMSNPLVLEVADVFDTYAYTHGIQGGDFSVGVAVGIFKSVVGLLMVLTANKVVKGLGHGGIY